MNRLVCDDEIPKLDSVICSVTPEAELVSCNAVLHGESVDRFVEEF